MPFHGKNPFEALLQKQARQARISARFEPAAPDPQLFSPAGEKFENRAPENTISLREMRIPSGGSEKSLQRDLMGRLRNGKVH